MKNKQGEKQENVHGLGMQPNQYPKLINLWNCFSLDLTQKVVRDTNNGHNEDILSYRCFLRQCTAE